MPKDVDAGKLAALCSGPLSTQREQTVASKPKLSVPLSHSLTSRSVKLMTPSVLTGVAAPCVAAGFCHLNLICNDVQIYKQPTSPDCTQHRIQREGSTRLTSFLAATRSRRFAEAQQPLRICRLPDLSRRQSYHHHVDLLPVDAGTFAGLPWPSTPVSFSQLPTIYRTVYFDYRHLERSRP